MSKEFEAKRIESCLPLIDKENGNVNETAQMLFRDNLLFYGQINGTFPEVDVKTAEPSTETESRSEIESDLDIVTKIVINAKKVAPIVCNLVENRGKQGFALAITKKGPNFPILTLEIGEVNELDTEYPEGGKRAKYADFARGKAKVLQYNPTFITSAQNSSLPEDKKIKSKTHKDMPGGAISVGDWIISVSAFKNQQIDTATAISIATEAGLLKIHDACVFALDYRVECSEFIEYFAPSYTDPVLQ